MRGVSVFGVDPPHEVREPVWREQQMKLPGDTQLVPGVRRLLRPAPTQANSGERGFGIAIDRVEHGVGAEALDQRHGALAPDVLYATQIRDECLGIRRRQWPRLRDLHLEAISAVVDPSADHARALALLQMHQRSDEHDLIAVLVGCVEHRPAGLLAHEACAPYRDLAIELHRAC